MPTGFNTRPIGGGEYEVDVTVDGDHEGTWTVDDDEEIRVTSTEQVNIYLNGDFITSQSIRDSGYVQIDDFVETVDYSVGISESTGSKQRWISQDFNFTPPICANIIDMEAVGSGGGAGSAGIAFAGGATQPVDSVSSNDEEEGWFQSLTRDSGAAVGRVGGFSGVDVNPLNGQEEKGNPDSVRNGPHWFSDIWYDIEQSSMRRTSGSFSLEMDYVDGGSYSFPNL